MTKNQILYQELLQTKRRDEVNAEVARGTLEENKRHNIAMEGETAQHNRVVEQQAWEQLTINSRQAAAAERNAAANEKNAESNRMNAETNRLNYQVNMMNAETNRLNYQVNVENATSNRMQAYAAQTQAAAAWKNAETNVRMADIAQQNAATNARMADIAQQNADTNVRMADIAWREYVLGTRDTAATEMNAETNRIRAEIERDKVGWNNIMQWLNYLRDNKLINSQVNLNRMKTDEAYANKILLEAKAETEKTLQVKNASEGIIGGLADLFVKVLPAVLGLLGLA